MDIDSEEVAFTLWDSRDSEVVKFLKLIKIPIKKKYGIDLGLIKKKDKIGEGSYGGAYKYGPNQVLKITTDEDEIKTSSYLVGKKTKHICRIDQVLEFPDRLNIKKGKAKIRVDLDGPLGFILQEFLPGGFEEGTDIDSFLSEISLDYSDYVNGDISTRQFDRKVWDIYYDERYYEDKPPFQDSIKESDVQDIINIATEIKKLRIKFYDLHGQNIRRAPDGHIKVIDIGLSQSPRSNVKQIKLEALRRKFKI